MSTLPHTPKEQCFLWVEMVQKLINIYKWIFVNNKNMVELCKEKFNICHLIFESKFMVWEQFKVHFKVEDFIESKTRLKYTRDNKWK
jgi:hypothetical protein